MEAMTAELIVEAEWALQDYWTKVRFPFQKHGGRWSDVDVLAYNPIKKHLVVSESKVQNTKSKVYAYTRDSNYDFSRSSYLGFLKNLGDILPIVLGRFAKPVKRITVQLVSNTVILPDVVEKARASVVEYVNGNVDLPRGVHVDAKLDSTLDVFARIVVCERERQQGRRYGHPVIDIARELNRYLDPSVAGAGQGKSKTDPVKRQGLRSFWDAIGGPDYSCPAR